LEEKGNGVFLDFGKNFGRYGFFHEVILKCRDTYATVDDLEGDIKKAITSTKAPTNWSARPIM
jgi:hypothetical protein